MGQVRFSVAVSLDGFMAGPDQSVEDPLGKGGMQLHQWAFAAWRGEEPVSAAILDETTENVGAYILGRNMFGGGRGDWGDGSWKGWWGDDPPYHAPVFIVTHHRVSPCRWRAARRSTSSPTASSRRWPGHGRRRVTGTSSSAAAPASSSSTCGPASWTSCS